MKIKKGQKWRRKTDHTKIGIIVSVAIDKKSTFGGYIEIECDWTKVKKQGRCLDSFLNQYEFYEH